MKYEKIIEMMEKELDSQPIASQRTIDARAALDDAIEECIEAVQQDAFYWGYMVAMKQLKKAGGEE